MFYHNAIDMLLLTEKLDLYCCYVLYEAKVLLNKTKMNITAINILIFIISIGVDIIIIFIIIIISTITVINISIIIAFVKSAW